MAQEVAALNVRLEATVARAERSVDRFTRKMNRSAKRIERSANSIDRRLERLGDRFGINLNPRILAATAAVAGLGKAINDIIRNGDKLRRLEGRFTALTGSANRASGLVQGGFGIGERTGVQFDAVASSLTRFRIAGDAIEATDEQVLQLTENIIKLGQIGGGSQQELQAGAIQLGQALAAGALRGDELRSVLENMPLVARAIADGLGVSVGKLREMGQAGELTAERVFQALLDKTDEIDRQYSQLPLTVERASGQLANAWTRFTAELDESLRVSEALAGVLNSISRGITALSKDLDDPLDKAERLINQRIAERDQRASDPAGIGIREANASILAALEERDRIFAERGRQSGGFALDPNDPRIPGALPPTDFAPGTSREPRERPFELGVPDPVSTGGGRGRQGFGFDDLLNGLEREISLLERRATVVSLNTAESAEFMALMQALQTAKDRDIELTDEQVELLKVWAEDVGAAAQNLEDMRDQLQAKADAEREAADAAREHQREVEGVSRALVGSILNARNAADALRAVERALLRIVSQRASDALSGALSGGIAALFGGGGGGGIAPPIAVGVPSALGNVFRGGAVQAFAKGGVVSSPTVFPMARGVGLMSEKDEEAIMPLARGPGQRLGVNASGLGGGTQVNVHNYSGQETNVESRNEGGQEIVDVIVGRVDEALAKGELDGSMRGRFAVSPKKIGR